MFLNTEELLSSLNIEMKEIPEKQKYWLVRTNSGIYYDDFVKDGYVSIGWNDFSNPSDFINTNMPESLRERISKKYPDKQPGRIYNQIRRFIYDINIGDVIMIPSESSTEIRFGIVTSEIFNRQIEDEGFIKSKKVNWIKRVLKDELDPYLFRMLQSHQTVIKADDYAHYIDRTMYSLYKKGEESYFILPVTKEKDISAYDLSQFLLSLIDTVRLINTLEEEDLYGLRDLDIKLNIQSPGFVELVSSAAYLVEKVVTIIKNALNGNQDLTNELLDKTSPDKLKKLEEQSKKIQEDFERVKAELPKDIFKNPPKE